MKEWDEATARNLSKTDMNNMPDREFKEVIIRIFTWTYVMFIRIFIWI